MLKRTVGCDAGHALAPSASIMLPHRRTVHRELELEVAPIGIGIVVAIAPPRSCAVFLLKRTPVRVTEAGPYEYVHPGPRRGTIRSGDNVRVGRREGRERWWKLTGR